MLDKIKNNIENTLLNYTRTINSQYGLNKISPILYANITNYLKRQGKRIRASLFIISYLGFSKKPAANLYRCSLALELLHNFMLIHDDIIDRSDLRRGQPAMHKMLDKYLSGKKGLKFNGNDLAIVAADVIYAMAIDVFLSIKEAPLRKEQALRKFVESAVFTGSGEFVELLLSAKHINKIKRSDIDTIYDLKTAHYTFCSPLIVGAILAGAKASQIKLLLDYGIQVGRAFQIRDDILDMFGTPKQIGKSNLTDIKESKKTLLVWYAFKKSGAKDKAIIAKTLSKDKPSPKDLLQIRDIVVKTGSYAYAQQQIQQLHNRAIRSAEGLKIKPAYKKLLVSYPQKILSITIK